MSEKKLRRLPLAAAALVACMSAQADYQSPDGNFRLSGFGTLGAVHSSTNDVFFNYPGQGGGAGTTPSMSPDSKVAVQGTYKFTPTLSGTAQVMTRYDANSQYVPSVDWLFAKWQVAPSLVVRGGRLVAPMFMVSDFRNVGYANTTVRPNLDVYGQVPVDQLEGGDVTFQHALGSTTFNFTLFAGDANAEYTSAFRKGATAIGPSSFSLKKTKGINVTAEMDNGLTLRGGYSRSKINITSDSIGALRTSAATLLAIPGGAFGGAGAYFNNLGTQINTQVEKVDVYDRNVSFTGFGATYDQDEWIIAAEYTKRRSDNFVADTTGWYTLVGYRLNKFTPYIGFSKLSVNSANVSTSAVAPAVVTGNATVDGNLSAYAAAANSGLQGYLDVQKLAQRTITLGTRWDVTPNVALKAQWDQIHKPADSWGLFFTKDPSTAEAQSFLNSRRKVNVLSVSMDFVF